ncbi:hypothetical protein ACOSP7_011377 [Xanthoceras sorbifolium]
MHVLVNLTSTRLIITIIFFFLVFLQMDKKIFKSKFVKNLDDMIKTFFFLQKHGGLDEQQRIQTLLPIALPLPVSLRNWDHHPVLMQLQCKSRRKMKIDQRRREIYAGPSQIWWIIVC